MKVIAHVDRYRHKVSQVILAFLLLQLCSCREKSFDGTPLFTALDADRTGLKVNNALHYDQAFNLFKYIYFYNGSGIGAADFNNDGLVDLFLGGNQTRDRLFLNNGNLQFNEITDAAGIPDDGGWTTGISVVDINQDGLMDIYVCRVGNYETLHSQNLLLVNQGLDSAGVPRFRDEASGYGLNFSGFSTQAAFFDYDLDGDLDLFLLNHSVHENGTFRPRTEFLGTTHPLAGDRFYKNEGRNGFVDYTALSGINSSAIGYGLGVVVSDINNDGYPDLYIGNDFHENDYLYINQRNGSFRDVAAASLKHTSQYSMGVDAADADNDGRSDIISVDMLPEDPVILKRSLGEDAFDIFQHKISVGYSYQYTRNNLQWNRPDSAFSEIGLYSGVAASDWSWAPLWMDFDNDGWKDLFISNGIPKRMNDIDYVNFVSNTEMRKSIDNNAVKEKDIRLIEKFPEIKLPNKFYRNQGQLQFSDQSALVRGDQPGFSNGAVYADLDNDGDLDIVVNNIDGDAVLYENNHQPKPGQGVLQLQLTGPDKNRQAIGARLLAFGQGQIRVMEKFPVHGFLSSMNIPLQLGLEGWTLDSLWLVWPDQTAEKLEMPDTGGYRRSLSVEWKPDLPRFDRSISGQTVSSAATVNWVDAAGSVGLQFNHVENHFVEFDREPLVPHMLSTEGPALAVADINGDGWEDVWIGGARNQSSTIFLQDGKGRFYEQASPALRADSMMEDVDAVWADMNGDHYPDLLVASAGNEFYGRDWHNAPRLYLNDGKGNLTRFADAFSDIYITASSMAVADLDGDGINDLFIGARTIPWEYGQMPQSFLLKNDGTGRFQPFSKKTWQAIQQSGMVTDAHFADIDGNGQDDLILALEWGPVTAWMRHNDEWIRTEIGSGKGWWNFVLPVDIDGDGDKDIVAGNLGWNSRLKADSTHPVRLYYNDFDQNGKHEQVMTYYLGERELPFPNKAELERQLPLLKKKFLYAEDFAKASLKDLFGKEELSNAVKWEANCFSNVVYMNQGNGRFKKEELPWQAQLSQLRTAALITDRFDGQKRLLALGNYYDNNIQMGRYDADFGSMLIRDTVSNWHWSSLKGLRINGQVRRVKLIRMPKGDAWILARNNGPIGLLRQW